LARGAEARFMNRVTLATRPPAKKEASKKDASQPEAAPKEPKTSGAG
jgi:hypothetical protein